MIYVFIVLITVIIVGVLIYAVYDDEPESDYKG